MSERAVSKRQYTEEFKMEAVRLADSVGGYSRPLPATWRKRQNKEAVAQSIPHNARGVYQTPLTVSGIVL